MDETLFSGKYIFQGEIARGGMGVVYRATQSMLNRQVAIKILHPQFSGDAAFVKRFQREARAMARLNHENVIQVVELVEDKGSFGIVMEFFSGKDLKRILMEKGQFTEIETVKICFQIANALAYSHSQGVVHRDIKPGNIMIDDNGKIKIADFGIAAATDEVSVTVTGQIIGTPEYMSPEQARGEQLDGRSDLYSLGMLLYEMLAGQTPFHGLSRMSIIGKLLYEKEEYELSLPPDTSPLIVNIVAKLLKRNFEDRILDAPTLMIQLAEVMTQFGMTVDPVQPQTGSVKTTPAIEKEEGPTVMLRGTETGQTSLRMEAGSRAKATPTGTPSASSAMKKTPSSKPSALTPAGVPATRRKIVVVAAASVAGILLIGGILFYGTNLLNKDTTPAPRPPGYTGPPPFLPEVRALQISIGEAKDRVSFARIEADQAEAPKRAPEPYESATGMELKGSEALQEGTELFNQEKYEASKEPFEEALSLFGQANDGFIFARDTAISNKADEETALAKKEDQAKREKARLAKIERDRKAKAEKDRLAKITRDRKAKAEKDRLAKLAKAVPPRPPMPADINTVQKKFQEFKKAYEGHDFDTLRKMTVMSKSTERIVNQILQQYKMINVSVSGFTINSQTASAKVTITKLIDGKGDTVFPSDRWRQTDIKISKEGNKWGKIIW